MRNVRETKEIMRKRTMSALGWLAVLLALAALTAAASAAVREIRPRPSDQWGRDRGYGQMDIRLRVDGEVEVAVQGDRVFVQTLHGRPAFDAGSEYSAPLPRGNVAIDLDRRDGRGRVWLVAEPSQRNRFAAIFRISDPQGGDDRYHVRLRFDDRSNGRFGRDDRWRTGDPRNDNGFGRPGEWRDDDWRAVRRDDDGRGDGWRGGNDGYWNGTPWRRPSSWRGMPGVPLDRRFQDRGGDYRGRNGGRFEFRGRVDDEVLFFIRGGQVTAQTLGGRRIQYERWSIDDPFPVGRPVRIDVDRKDGRGRVQLLEEPNPRNNYTAVLRVYDPSGGSDRYHVRVEWRF